MRKLGQWLVLVVLSASIGLHWAVLQTAAWTGMLVTYSRQSDWKTGLIQTFDGQHPCPLCKVVAEGRAAERGKAEYLSGQKTDFVLLYPLQFVWQPPGHAAPFARSGWGEVPTHSLPPPVPPPRGT